MVITAEMKIGDIVSKYPQAAEVFTSFGMGCISCGSAAAESIQKGAMLHGIELKELMEKLNEVVDQGEKEPKKSEAPKVYSLLKKRNF